MLEARDWITLGGMVLLFLGTLITVQATRGKTRSDYKTAFDERIDKRVSEYMDDLERQNKEALHKAQELEARVEHLEDAQEKASKREKALYRYTASLRDFILAGNPPPPPPVPEELRDWYDAFDVGKGLA